VFDGFLAVHRLAISHLTQLVTVVMLSLAPILWESRIGSHVMKPIAAPVVGWMITSTINALILVPLVFAMMKSERSGPSDLRPRSTGQDNE
jgi:Cu(I)/Ag(I) efflux system membrane protein CusA/SilA